MESDKLQKWFNEILDKFFDKYKYSSESSEDVRTLIDMIEDSIKDVDSDELT